jgi:RNA polymerase sigma-70 factor (ECF subfamily)
MKVKLPPPFEDSMHPLEREIMRFIVVSTRDREAALDIFQETWLRAYRAWPELKSHDGVRPWVYRIASNLCRNRIRSIVRRARAIDDSVESADALENHRSGSLDGGPEILLHVRRAIGKLPDKQGRALMMRKIAGLEYVEIAAALKCSEESARACVYQALRKLKAELL